MYSFYYLNTNKQPESAGGNYELHKENCSYCSPSNTNFDLIGMFVNETIALRAAKEKHPDKANKIDGCAYCCKTINNESQKRYF